MSRILILSILIFGCFPLFAQTHHNRLESIDVMQYGFEIHLNDSTNVIEGRASVIFNVLKLIESITLDLTSINSSGKGMKVKSVKTNHIYANFSHKNDFFFF